MVDGRRGCVEEAGIEVVNDGSCFVVINRKLIKCYIWKYLSKHFNEFVTRYKI